MHIAITGRIDERFDPGVVPPDVSKIIVHLGGVQSVSSIGVRTLERFFDSLRPREVTLIHVAPSLALQAILIPQLTSHAQVQSAKLPFVCGKCQGEKNQSVPWRHDAHKQFAPTCTCGTVMELDGLADHYLPS